MTQEYTADTMQHHSTSDGASDTDTQWSPVTKPQQHSNVTGDNDHTHDDDTNIVRVDVNYKVARELSRLKTKFSELSYEARQALANVPLRKLEAVARNILEDDYTAQSPTYEALFDNIMDNSSCLDYLYLKDIIETFLKDAPLNIEFEKYSIEVEKFMDSTTLVSLKDQVIGHIKSGRKTVELKLGPRWKKVTIKQFKHLQEMIFERKYLSQMTVNEGCLCVMWTTTNTTSTIVKNKAYNTEFMMAIGVLHLTVGDTIIYKTQQQDTSMTLDEAMIKTLESGPISAVELLLAVGANPNQQLPSGDTVISRAVKITDQYDSTILYNASQNGHSEVVSILLKANADPSIAESDGWTPLIIASQNGHKDTVDLLIDAKAGVNVQANDGKTALYIASQNGHFEVVSILLKANADPSIAKKNGWTPLMIASHNGHKDTVDLLIDAKADVNVQNNNGATALSIACQNGHSEVVSILLKANADPFIAESGGWTSLMIASHNGHTDTVDLLIDAKADVNVQNNNINGATALYIACQNGHSEIVSILLKANADPSIAKKIGWTPLMIASHNGYKDTVDLLIDAKADVNVQNNNGATALYIACQNRHSEVVSILLKGNADPSIAESNGWSPLMIASSVGDIGTVLLLHQYNADINYSTVTGETALSCASDNNVFQILLDCGADINMLQISQQQPSWSLEQVRQEQQIRHRQSRLHELTTDLDESLLSDIPHPSVSQEPKYGDNPFISQDESGDFIVY